MSAPMSTGLPVLVDNFITGEQYTFANDIANGIQQREYALMDVVEALGPFLTSTEVQTRAKGTRLLAETLCLLPNHWLNTNEVGVLVRFVCDRLRDHHSITPHVLKAANALLRTNAITGANIHQTLSAIFNEVDVQSLTQGDRRHVYHLVDYLLNNHLQDVKSMGADFILGYIHCMEGEKDPRNLVLGFRCVRGIASHLSLGTFTEDLFEVVACYFPVDFTPPPNDSHGIKREDLVQGLRSCLASNSQFAEFCLPLLLEKLSSTIQNAKIDSFLTLAECAATYGEKLVEYSGSIWSCIRREVFSSSSDSLEQAALTALVAMTTALSKLITPVGGDSLLDSFIQDVVQDLRHHLCEPADRLVQPSGKLLQAMGSASIPACSTILAIIIPFMLNEVERHKQASDRKVFLKELIQFLQLAVNWSDSDDNPVLRDKDSLYSLFVSLLSHSNSALCHIGVQGIMALADIPCILSAQEVENSSQHLLQIILTQDTETREVAVSGLNQLCGQLSPSSVKTICTQLTVSSDAEYDLSLDVMCKITSCLAVLQCAVPHYLCYLDKLGHQSGDDLQSASSAATTICDHLYTVIQNNIQKPECTVYLYDAIVQQVFVMCVQAAVLSECVLNQWEVVNRLAGCVRVIVCQLKNRTEQLLATTMSLFLEGDSSHLTNSLPHHADVSSFKPFNEDSPTSQTQLVSLFSAVVCSMPVTVPIPHHSEILTALTTLATRCQCEHSVTASAKCLAGLINKLNEDMPAPSVLTKFGKLRSDFQQNDVVVLIWLTKALLMRSHRDQKHLVDALVELLSSDKFGLQAAEGFRMLLEESQDILTNEMHAVIRFMYKQRLFVFTVDPLITGFNAAQKDARLPYLIALSHLLKYVPMEAMVSHLSLLLPLVVQCLHYEGDDLWISTLSTLSHMINKTPDLIMKYLDDLLTHLLNLSQYKHKMTVRIASLRCLCALTSLPVPVLIPNQKHVTKSLLPVLDDHKRLVRKEAVLTREKWFLVGAPGT